MKECFAKVKEFAAKDWTPAEKCLAIVNVLLLGVLIGWVSSPFLEGFSLFSNNTWDINTSAGDSEDEEEEDCE